MTSPRQSVPPGTVSSIQGVRQARALRIATVLAFVAALAALVLPGRLGEGFGVAAVAVVTATPLARVGWLIRRWSQERDWRFVMLGVGVLAVVGLGALAALAGLGSR